VAAVRLRRRRRVHLGAAVEKYFIAPTTQLPPFDVTQAYPTEIAGVKMSTYIKWMKVCLLISALENPSISTPCGSTADGLPIGLQIVDRIAMDGASCNWRTSSSRLRRARRKPAIA
jgi:amidase